MEIAFGIVCLGICAMSYAWLHSIYFPKEGQRQRRWWETLLIAPVAILGILSGVLGIGAVFG